MKNCGFTEEKAKFIETNYHKLYAVSDAWVDEKLNQAAIDGYVTCAFGLRLRTPILAQCVCKSVVTPYVALAERRSAGNAVSGQSYGMLTTRAGIEFQKRCLASPYKYDILPAAHIHDSIYLLIRDNAEVIKWVNDNLIECMAWQKLPEIQHEQIKLSSTLEIYWPNWSVKTSIPNHATKSKMKTLATETKMALTQ